MSRARQVAALAIATAALAGCASSPQQALEKFSTIDSPIELGRAIAVEQSKSADTGFGLLDIALNPLLAAPLRALTAGKVYESPGFRGDTQRWCGGKGDIWSATTNAFMALCKRKGGTFDSGFCSKTGERDQVLFMAKVNRSQNSYCRAQVQLFVAEPTASPLASDYMEFLLKAGFETNAARQARLDALRAAQREAPARQQEQADGERRRLAAHWPQTKLRDTRVSRESGDTTWVAFVEDEANVKLKMLLNWGYVTRNPAMGVNLPQATVLWEAPDPWRLC